MTNFEKIKSMDIIELSTFIDQNSGCLNCVAFQTCKDFPDLLCVDIIEKWLKMETECTPIGVNIDESDVVERS